MALMSVLFLYLLAPLPATLGLHNVEENVASQKNMSLTDRAMSLYHSGIINEAKELRPLFANEHCHECFICVEQAFDMLNSYSHQIDIMNAEGEKKHSSSKKVKRSADSYTTEYLENNEHKSVRVTKYKTSDDTVYAIKVNEVYNEASEKNNGKSTCKVYSVKKSSPCESEESNSILMKRKVNKKRMSKPKNTSLESRVITSVKNRKVLIEKSDGSESLAPPLGFY